MPTAADDEVLFSADCGKERTMPGGRVVRGKRVLYYGTMSIYNGRMDEQMAARLFGFIRDMGTRPVNEYVRIRAAAGVVAGGAVILPSPPEIHLPTLAAYLVREGAAHLGDEMINLDPILRRIHGLRFPIMVDGDDLQGIPGLRRERPRGKAWDKDLFRAAWWRQPVNVEEIGGRLGEPAPLGWIVFPYIEEGAETRLEPMGGAEAIFRFTEAVLNMHVWGDRTLILIRELLDAVPVSRLVVGSFEEAARLVVSTAPDMVEEVRT